MEYLLLIGLIFLSNTIRRTKIKQFQIQDIQRVYNLLPQIKVASWSFDIPADILAGLVLIESKGLPDARGGLGEVGLVQMRAIAGRDIGLNEIPSGVQENLNAGAEFLALQIRRMKGSIFHGLRAYNAGASRAKQRKNISSSYAHNVLFWGDFIFRRFGL